MPTDFIRIPIQYEGQQYDAWVTVNKFNVIFTQTDKEELERVLPKYFSVEPVKKLGFFSEDMNMKLDLVQEAIDTDLNIDQV